MKRAELQIATATPAATLVSLSEYMTSLEMEIETGSPGDDAFRVSCYGGSAEFAPFDGGVAIVALADDPGALANLRHMAAEIVRRTVPDARLVWSGDSAGDRTLPQFRAMRVVGSFDVTPRMRRVRLAGRDLARFASGGLHIRMIFAPDGREPVWPHGDPSGIPVWPDGPDELQARAYTIRSLDPQAGTMDVDMVRHGGACPGGRFAETAVPGDPVGIMGPGGDTVPTCDRLLLAGDETALPAMARILESLPDHVRGTALIEVADPNERQALRHPPGVELVWLPRHGEPAGSTRRLSDAITALDWPGESDSFVWIGAEYSIYRSLRDHCRRVWRLPKRRMSVLPYWRRQESA